ncbi:MAG: hypothetical protein GEU93_06365 [Propionibacteriales bacterium]|nr:hypothetical protein [Propionibacteriales bacterium]
MTQNPIRFHRLALVAAAITAVGLFTAGCGGDNGSGSAGGTIEISADPSGAIKYEQTEVTAPAGEVTIDFTNESSVPHDVAIEEGSEVLGKTDIITESSTSTTVELSPGTYTFYCTVQGHRQAGMEGTLVVE